MWFKILGSLPPPITLTRCYSPRLRRRSVYLVLDYLVSLPAALSSTNRESLHVVFHTQLTVGIVSSDRGLKKFTGIYFLLQETRTCGVIICQSDAPADFRL